MIGLVMEWILLHATGYPTESPIGLKGLGTIFVCSVIHDCGVFVYPSFLLHASGYPTESTVGVPGLGTIISNAR